MTHAILAPSERPQRYASFTRDLAITDALLSQAGGACAVNAPTPFTAARPYIAKTKRKAG